MERRAFLASGLSTLALLRVTGTARAAQAPAGRTISRTAGFVRDLARELSRHPYRAPSEVVPDRLRDIGYDAYREIRFRPEKSIWRKEGLGFELQMFPAAYLYQSPVEIFLVDEGRIRRLRASRSLFDLGELGDSVPAGARMSFSGFRIHAPINRRDRYDEFLVFQGASYFRGVGKGHGYGLSARALAIDTTGPGDEEFPLFRSFWIERPETPGAITVHGLLDGPSVTGAYTLVIRPGAETVVDTEAVLFPRRDLHNVGIAPLTSMFLKDTHDPAGPLDFRPSVHDSDGLAIWNGRDEHLWRPLRSPSALAFSAFGDSDPKGFGLVQRARRFEDYEDLEARYEQRPSGWVNPSAGWGEGAVELMEIPTAFEYFDNIVAYWRPKAPLPAGRAHAFSYRLAWCDDAPEDGLLRVHKTRIGAGSRPGAVRFVIDFAGEPGRPLEQVAGNTAVLSDAPPFPTPDADLSSDGGELFHRTVQLNPHVGGARATFELDPKGRREVELRLTLTLGGEPASETWLYRWEA